MLADKIVELNHVESLSHETVRQTLKKWNQTLAKEVVYLNGTLPGGTEENKGKSLPPGYIKQARLVAQQRIALAGYRLANLLKQLY